MALSKLIYSKDWRNPEDFPTYSTNETQIRDDQQILHDEARDALNKLIDDLKAEEIPFAPTPEIPASNVRAALLAIQNQIAEATTGSLPDYSIESIKLAEPSITEPKMANDSITARAVKNKEIKEPKLDDESVSTRTLQPECVTREKMDPHAYDDKANLVNGRIKPEELTKSVKYISSAYTLALSDTEVVLAVTASTNMSVTIPSNVSVAFPVGTDICVVSRNDKEVTIAAASGVTLLGVNKKLMATGEVARLTKIASEVWCVDISSKFRKDMIPEYAVDRTKIQDEEIINSKLAPNVVTHDKLAEDAVRLKFSDVSVSVAAFVEDTAYEDFPLRAAIELSGVTEDMVPEVNFDIPDIMEAIFASVSRSYDGGVYIYASQAPEKDIIIPTIVCRR